jgi:hypothetical protein
MKQMDSREFKVPTKERIQKLDEIERILIQEKEQEFLNEIANTVLNFFASAGEKDIKVLEQQINEIKKKYGKSQ